MPLELFGHYFVCHAITTAREDNQKNNTKESEGRLHHKMMFKPSLDDKKSDPGKEAG